MVPVGVEKSSGTGRELGRLVYYGLELWMCWMVQVTPSLNSNYRYYNYFYVLY